MLTFFYKYNVIMQHLWKHSFCCAVASKWLAVKAGYETLAQEAFLAGLLHDIGNVYMLKVIEDVGKAKRLQGDATHAIVSEVLSNMHVEEGLKLMQLWHLPDIYCAVVAGHEAEPWDRGNALLAMVRLADQTCNKLNVGMHPDLSLQLFASAEAQVLGLKEIALAELEIIVEDALKHPMSG